MDSRVRNLETENDGENSTVAIKSECSSREQYETNLTSLGFLLPEYTGRYKFDKGVEKLSDNVIKNVSKLWSNINKNYYKIKKYLLELFSLH